MAWVLAWGEDHLAARPQTHSQTVVGSSGGQTPARIFMVTTEEVSPKKMSGQRFLVHRGPPVKFYPWVWESITRAKGCLIYLRSFYFFFVVLPLLVRFLLQIFKFQDSHQDPGQGFKLQFPSFQIQTKIQVRGSSCNFQVSSFNF